MKQGGGSNLIVLRMTYEMEIWLYFQVLLVQRDPALSFARGKSLNSSKAYIVGLKLLQY